MARVFACEELAAAILSEPAPVIFLDAAAVLNILRVPFRPELQADILSAAVGTTLLASARPKHLWMVSSANFTQELGDNRDYVVKELHTSMAALTDPVNRVAAAAAIVLPDWEFPSLDLPAFFEERIVIVLDRFVNALALFRGTGECVKLARNRVWAGVAPASRAKQEFKDCEIFEEFLELSRSLRRSGFSLPVVFVSPNAKDFGPAPEGFPPVEEDLRSVGASYAANISWARALIDERSRE